MYDLGKAPPPNLHTFPWHFMLPCCAHPTPLKPPCFCPHKYDDRAAGRAHNWSSALQLCQSTLSFLLSLHFNLIDVFSNLEKKRSQYWVSEEVTLIFQYSQSIWHRRLEILTLLLVSQVTSRMSVNSSGPHLSCVKWAYFDIKGKKCMWSKNAPKNSIQICKILKIIIVQII